MRLVYLILCVSFAVLADDTYEGYKACRIVPSTKKQLESLIALKKEGRYDFWSSPVVVGRPTDVMVGPADEERFFRSVNRSGLSCQTLVEDMREALRQIKSKVLTSKASKGKISFNDYLSYEQINAYLDHLAKEYPDVVSVETIGKSYEGRDLKVVQISTDFNASKPVIFIHAGIHAREWVTPVVGTYIINQLVQNSSTLLDKVDWHIVPIINPDGYEYSRNDNHMWRKTRSKGESCDGVDGNRNFGFHWGESGSSPSECSVQFSGPSAFSEPETQALSNYMLNHKDIKLYLGIHSYGRYILYPWGYTEDLPDNHKELQDLGVTVANSIEGFAKDHGSYSVGSSSNILYASSGTGEDWAKGVAGIDLAYTIEVRGAGKIGFFPPKEEVFSIVEDTWVGIKAFHQYIEQKFGPE